MSKLNIGLIILAGTLITIFPALQNGYPLIYFDSDTYINLGMKLAPNKTNPFGYGIFVWLFSMKLSLWPVIFVQSLIINSLIFRVLKDFFQNNSLIIYYLIIIVILSLFTGFSWFSSMIMADIFVAVMLLAVYLFMKENASKQMIYISGIVILFAASTHFTITFNLFLLSILFTLITYFKRKELSNYKSQLYKSLLLVLPILILFILKSDDFFRKDVKDKGVSHVFIMARLMETGILDDYLDKNCEEKQYDLCNYINQFPNSQSEFVWEKTSPLYLTDGWKDTNNEYREIIRDIFSKPYYLGMLAYKSIISGVRQIFCYDIELITLNEESSINQTLSKHFKHEIKKFRTSKQFRNLVNLNAVNSIQNILIIVSLAMTVYFLLNRKNKIYTLAFVLFTGIVFNAIVCGTISTVVNRYQARVAWLLIFIFLIIVMQKIFALSKVKQIDD